MEEYIPTDDDFISGDTTGSQERQEEPEQEEQSEYIHINELIQLWDETFNIYSFNNPEYNRACLHLIIGALLKDCRIKRNGTKTDPRYPILYLKPTFSGGSAGFDMVSDIAENLGLKVSVVSDTTDAALIGSLEKDDAGYTEIKGILDKSKSDIIYWGEASMLFQKNLPSHQVKTRNYLQSGLNPIDSKEAHLKKYMKGGTVKCDVEATLLQVSFPPSELDDNILRTGDIQRKSLIIKTLDLDGRMENIEADIDRYGEEINVNDNKDKIVRGLLAIRKNYEEGTIFTVEPTVIRYIKTTEKEILDPFKTSNARIQEHIGSFVAASLRKVMAIAMHHCAMCFGNRADTTTITRSDFEYAFEEIIKPQISMIHEYLEGRPEHQIFKNGQDAELRKIKLIFKTIMEKDKKTTNDYIQKESFLLIIKKAADVTSSRSVYKRYKMMIENGDIEETKEGVKFK